MRILDELLPEKDTCRSPARKQAKLSASPGRKVLHNSDAFSGEDGMPSVWLICGASSRSGKSKKRASGVEQTIDDIVLLEPESGKEIRRIPARKARTLARGRNRLVPPPTFSGKRKSPRKSHANAKNIPVESDSDATDTEVGKEEDLTNMLLISQNPSVLSRKSHANLLPFFDDYEDYLSNEHDAEAGLYPITSADAFDGVSLSSKAATRSRRMKSTRTGSVLKTFPSSLVRLHRPLDFCLSVPITIPAGWL